MSSSATDLNIEFEPLTRGDFPLLARWLSAEHVRRWWLDHRIDSSHLEENYGPRIDGRFPHVSVIRLNGSPIGIVQWSPIDDDADWSDDIRVDGSIAIDYLIGDAALVGRGLGTRVLRQCVATLRELFPDATGIVADPDRDNTASCRVLEKAGFRCIYEGPLEDEADVRRVYFLPREAV